MFINILFSIFIVGCSNSETNKVNKVLKEEIIIDSVIEKDVRTFINIDTRTKAPIYFFIVNEMDDATVITKSNDEKKSFVQKEIIGNKKVFIRYSLQKNVVPFVIAPGDSIEIKFTEQNHPFVFFSKLGNKDRYNIFSTMSKNTQTLFSTSNHFFITPPTVDIDKLYNSDKISIRNTQSNDTKCDSYYQTCSMYLESQFQLEKFQVEKVITNKSILSDDKYLEFPNFRNLLTEYEYEINSKNSKNMSTIMTNRYKSALNQSGEIKNYLLFNTMTWMKNKDVSLFNKYKSDFLSNCTNLNYTTQLVFQTKATQIIGNEFIAYNDTVPISFNQILKNNLGNIIYIDLWASWCAPCRAQMESNRLIQNKFANKPISFIYASIDDNINSWKKAVKEEKIENSKYNFFIYDQKNSQFIKSHKVTLIPRYILYDKYGKLIQENAPAPESEEFEKLIDKLLQSK